MLFITSDEYRPKPPQTRMFIGRNKTKQETKQAFLPPPARILTSFHAQRQSRETRCFIQQRGTSLNCFQRNDFDLIYEHRWIVISHEMKSGFMPNTGNCETVLGRLVVVLQARVMNHQNGCQSLFACCLSFFPPPPLPHLPPPLVGVWGWGFTAFPLHFVLNSDGGVSMSAQLQIPTFPILPPWNSITLQNKNHPVFCCCFFF